MENNPGLRREVDHRLTELNHYLVEAGVRPVPTLSDGSSPAQLYELLDYLDLPAHVDARVDHVLSRVLVDLRRLT